VDLDVRGRRNLDRGSCDEHSGRQELDARSQLVEQLLERDDRDHPPSPTSRSRKSVSPQTASVGDTVTAAFTVTNGGPNGTGGVVTDALPPGVQLAPNPPNNASSASCRQRPGGRVADEHRLEPDPSIDDEVVYTLTASNAGPNDASGVTIEDLLPAGLEFIDASRGCDNAAGTVTCDLGTIANGNNSSVTIKALTTAALAGSSAGNLASVTANEPDPNLANNQASATIDVQPLVDLRLTKVASNRSPTEGGPVGYTLSLVNSGPSPATG
jgi:uncharacterized repeat protein (TIGR01451 family)